MYTSSLEAESSLKCLLAVWLALAPAGPVNCCLNKKRRCILPILLLESQRSMRVCLLHILLAASSFLSRALTQGLNVTNCLSSDWALENKTSWRCSTLASNSFFYWRFINSTVTSNNITYPLELLEIGMEVWLTNSTGLAALDWVALGFSELGSMKGSDVALIQRVEYDLNSTTYYYSPEWTLQDRFGTQFAEPPLSDEQLKQLVSVEDNTPSNGALRVRFTMPRYPCNTSQHENITQGVSSNLIFAFGSGAFDYHGPSNRGGVRVMLDPLLHSPPSFSLNASASHLSSSKRNRHSRLLLNSTAYNTSPAPADDEMLSMDIFMPNLIVPNSETDPYMCYTFLLPSDDTYSITSFDAVVNSTGGSQETYVHHQLLLNCSAGKIPDSFGQAPFFCSEMPEGCSVITLEAANKPGTFTYPPEAGKSAISPSPFSDMMT